MSGPRNCGRCRLPRPSRRGRKAGLTRRVCRRHMPAHEGRNGRHHRRAPAWPGRPWRWRWRSGGLEPRADRSAAVRRPGRADLRRPRLGHRLRRFRQWRALGVGDGAGAARPADRADPGHRRRDARRGAPAAPAPFFLRFDSAEIADRSDGEPLGYMVENRHIRAALAEAVRAAGIEVLAPARVARRGLGRRGGDGDPGRRARPSPRRWWWAPRAAARWCAARPGSGPSAGTIRRPAWSPRCAGAAARGRRPRILPARRALRHPAADRQPRQPGLDRDAARGPRP